jgi:hypothetical protein
MVTGNKPKINPKYLEKIGLTSTEEKLPEHIKIKIKKSRRRHVEKLGLKRVIENEDFIRIKYVRYADDFIIGVRGSLKLAQKIKELIKNFLKGVLHLELNDEKTKITNTYSDRAKFLGMYIYNMNATDLPYRNSREVESTKRVLRKNEVVKSNATIKILKNTRGKIIKTLNDVNKRDSVTSVLKDMNTKGKVRNKIRELAIAINQTSVEDEGHTEAKHEILNKIPKKIARQVPINRVLIMNKIHAALTKYNAVSTDRAKNKGWPVSIKKLLDMKKLTYCPEEITLSDADLEKITLKGSKQEHKYSASNN